MKRKIIKQANKSYTLTLPISWIRDNNLNEKSEVDLDIIGKSLIVKTDKIPSGKSSEINANFLGETNTIRHIEALYSLGIDDVKIISKKDISSRIIKSLNQMVGFALIGKENDIYHIKDISGGKESDLEEIFKRVFQVVLLFYQSAIEGIFGKTKETRDDLDKRDNEINKLCLYLQRAINKSSYNNIEKGRVLFTYSFALEEIADEIHRLWRIVVEDKLRLNKEIKELCDLSLNCLEKSFDMNYQFNSGKIEEIYKTRNELRKKISKTKITNSRINLFLTRVLKITESSCDLTHLTLMMKL